MTLKIFYEAIDPYCSSMTQVFIGIDEKSCWNQKYEFDKWLERHHSSGIRCIYRDKFLSIE